MHGNGCGGPAHRPGDLEGRRAGTAVPDARGPALGDEGAPDGGRVRAAYHPRRLRQRRRRRAADAPAPPTSEHVAGARAGVGAAEAARRVLTADDLRAVVRAQIQERRAEADGYQTHGRGDAADRLRREADVLGTYLTR